MGIDFAEKLYIIYYINPASFHTFKEKTMSKNFFSPLAILAVISLVVFLAVTPASAAPQASVSIIRLGNAADATPALNGPSYFFQGNGAPDPTAFQAHINQLVSAPLDIVVLAASLPTSGSKTPECDVLINLNNVNSCTTVTLTKSTDANNSQATAVVNNAESVYFAGGNQCNYVKWKGSSVYNAVKNVVARGGGIGGGSAGLAIQGEYVYDARRYPTLITATLLSPIISSTGTIYSRPSPTLTLSSATAWAG
jgi:cyanophycinase-like exopeptidase